MHRYDYSVIRESKRLFPEDQTLHNMLISGDPKAVDVVFSRIGFNIDEDDILRAFRNKKQDKLVEVALRAKKIRELYQKIYSQAVMFVRNDDEMI